MKKFGLIGYPLEHSFSKQYYTEKFNRLGLTDHQYELFPLPVISSFPQLLHDEPELCGLNVTIPHKIGILYYLNWVSPEAKQANAVNCIKIIKKDPLHDLFSGECSLEPIQLHGYNTDVYGFETSLKPLLRRSHHRALILGNGGAARAVQYVLKSLNIDFTIVSRKASRSQLGYDALSRDVMQKHTLIINTTPLGTFPNVADVPDIPFEYLGSKHLLYDLIYNPEETEFLKRGRMQGAVTKNGLEMLELQAEKNWEIWQA